MPHSGEQTPATEVSAVPAADPSDKMEEPNPAVKTGPGGCPTGPQMMALNTHKAGMEGLDAEKINEIIQKASEGSRFYQHKQKCQDRLNAKIAEMMKAKDSFSEQQISKAIKQMDQLIDELELERDLTQTIVHVDMDMFYAAVEMRDDPSLRDKPMAVGGTGMLSTSNYAARKFGVRAAMPGFIGKKLCPELIIVPPNFTKYKKSSKEVQEVFAEYDPNFSPMSLDEAYLNITEYMKKNAHLYVEDAEDDTDGGHLAESIVKELREKIHKKTSLTASAGIAPNTRLAKVCSDMNKPNGQFYLPPNRQVILDFMSSLPVRKVSGIGNVTEQQLSALGVNVCSDLLEKRGLLRLLFSDINYNYFMRIVLGLGSTSLEAWTERDRKSISTETTFRGTADKNFLFQQIEDLCQELADELSEKDIHGKVFTLKIKTIDFKVKTKAHSFLEATRSCEALMTTARRLLQQEMDMISPEPLSLRLIGVRMSSLLSSSEVGSARQVTITDLFSKAGHSKSLESVKSSKAGVNIHSEIAEKLENNHDLIVQNLGAEQTVSDKGDVCPTSLRTSSSNIDCVASKIENSKTLCIDSFLTKSEKTKDTPMNKSFECPVCNKEIPTTSIAKFNIHVDECLEDSAFQQERSDTDDAVDNSVLDPAVREDVTACQKFSSVVCSSEKEGSVSNLGNEPARTDSTNVQSHEMLTCPVCNQRQFFDVNLLNEHLDECLNKKTIDEIVREKECSSDATSQNLQGSAGSSFPGPGKSTNKKKKTVQGKGRPSKKVKTSNNTLRKYFSP
ncbi:DNA polymerase kappa-like [Macrobrachium rosenbergii]|uniref:DNA polymerase kappa-like n=1 Tax=Macrobrachium rosenbergii TaxID=79674 RepID=UPI0034D3E472